MDDTDKLGDSVVAALLTVYVGFLCLFMAFVLQLQQVAAQLFMPMVGAGCLGLMVGVYRLHIYLSKEDARTKKIDAQAREAEEKLRDATPPPDATMTAPPPNDAPSVDTPPSENG